jgi:hypothetical protein
MRDKISKFTQISCVALLVAGCSVADVRDQAAEVIRDHDPRPLSMADNSGQSLYFNSLRRVMPGGHVLAGLPVRTAGIATTTERKIVRVDARDATRYVQTVYMTAPTLRLAFRPDAQAIEVGAMGHAMEWDPTLWGMRPAPQDLVGSQVDLRGGGVRQMVTWTAYQPPTRNFQLFSPFDRQVMSRTLSMHCASARDYKTPTGFLQSVVGSKDIPPGQMFSEVFEARVCVSSDRHEGDAVALLDRAMTEMPGLSRTLLVSGR